MLAPLTAATTLHHSLAYYLMLRTHLKKLNHSSLTKTGSMTLHMSFTQVMP